MRYSIVSSLIKKEFYQIIRDPSSILIAFILPLILLFLFGFGINFDTNTVKIGVVIQDKTPIATEILDTMRHSRFLDVKVYDTVKLAEYALQAGKIRGFAVIPNDFTKKYLNPLKDLKPSEILVVADGSEPNTAKFVSAYIQGSLTVYKNITIRNKDIKGSKIFPIERFWYNPALKSTYFVLPGSLAIIMTMIGTVLTALVIAREWERGTMEALLTTNITKGEFILAKYIAYFALGMASIIFCLFFIIAIFQVPFNGSYFALLFVSALFMTGALGFGFIISTLTKDQFIASQIAGVAGFMPSLMLSGLIYEINSMPLFLRILTIFIPARYYVSSITSLFLSGTIIKTLLFNSLFLGIFALLMFLIVYQITPLRFEKC